MEIVVARSPVQRLVGLAGRRRPPPQTALLFRRCRSVHTFGMRFAIDVVFIDAAGKPIRVDRDIPPGRVLASQQAQAVLEGPAGTADEMIRVMAQQSPSKLAAALDPRQPIYRDTYNEYFVFLLSAGGAVAGTQVPLYILMAITGIWSVWVFVAACVVFELVVIFGLARPQMAAQERIGWVLLWGFTTAVMAVAFYYLVAEPTL